MKKIILFIVVPAIVLIFAVLNAILLFNPTTPYAYTNSANSSQIRVIDDVYFIKDEANQTTELKDFGLLMSQNNGIVFYSEIAKEVQDIKINNVFCITIQDVSYYSVTGITLQVIYGIIIVAGIITVAIGLYKNKQ